MKNQGKSSLNTRRRRWDIITYLPVNVVDDLCKNIPNILYYAYAQHDKDLCEDGTPKELHCHVIIVLRDSRDGYGVMRWFIDEDLNAGNCRVKPIIYLKKAYEYLWHKNEDDTKYKYSPDIVHTNCKKYFVGDGNDDKDNTLQIVDDIIFKRRMREMVSLYGRDFVIHYGDYKFIADIIAREENNVLTPTDDDMPF